ncbi:MAG: hypothetical protein GYA17_20945 [Chloroflexi bacterium]|nr:hypothetical protein [Chloroflexota bacterium]
MNFKPLYLPKKARGDSHRASRANIDTLIHKAAGDGLDYTYGAPGPAAESALLPGTGRSGAARLAGVWVPARDVSAGIYKSLEPLQLAQRCVATSRLLAEAFDPGWRF